MTSPLVNTLDGMRLGRYSSIQSDVERLAKVARQEHESYLAALNDELLSVEKGEIDDATFVAFVKAMWCVDTRWPPALSNCSGRELQWLEGKDLPRLNHRYRFLRLLFSDLEFMSGQLIVDRLLSLAAAQISHNYRVASAVHTLQESIWCGDAEDALNPGARQSL